MNAFKRLSIGMIIWLIGLILLPILFAGCCKQRVLTRYETTEIKTVHKNIPFTLRVPPIFTEQTVYLDTLQIKPSILETEFCFSRVYWDNELQHELRQKQARIDTIIKVEEKHITTTIKEPYEVNILTWWQRLWINTGKVLTFGILIAFLFWRITK